jgi:hypothetical protein
MEWTFAPGQKPWVDQFQMTPEQAAQQAAQQRLRDERDSAMQAASLAAQKRALGQPTNEAEVEARNFADARGAIDAEKAKYAVTAAQQQKQIDANTFGGAKGANESVDQYNSRRSNMVWSDADRQQYNTDTLNKEKDPALNAMASGKTPTGYSYDTQNQSYRRSDSSGTPRASTVTPAGATFADIKPGVDGPQWSYATSTTSQGERDAQKSGAPQVGAFAPATPSVSTPSTYKPTSTDKASGPSGFKSFSQENEKMAAPQFVNKQMPTVGPPPAMPSFSQPKPTGAPQLGTASSGGLIQNVPYSGGTGGSPGASQLPWGPNGPADIVDTMRIPGPQIPTQPQGSNLPGSRSDPWAGVDLTKFNAADFNPGGKFYNPGSPPPQDMSGLLKPQGGFTMPSGGMQLPTTATPGSNAQQPTYNAPTYGGSTSQGTQIDPANTLRTQQFLPGNTQNPYDAQAIAAMNAVQGGNVQNPYDTQAAGLYGGANMPTEFSPMVGESRDMIMERLRALSGPDRTQLAQEAYDIFRQQSEPGYQQDLRGVGQKAAALGRVGAGMTTNDLTGVMGQREQQQNLLKRSLINDAGQQTLQDRINTLNATMGGSSTLEGQDFGRQNAASQLAIQKAAGLSGMGQNQYNREYNNQNLGMDKARMLTDAGNEDWRRGQDNYNQNANERSYQDYLARTALQDRIKQQEMQQKQAEAEWQRNYDSNQQAAYIAAQQNTGYPNVSQPQGDSFAAGQQAGAGTPTYNTGGYQGTAPTFNEPNPLGFDPLAGMDTSAWGPDTGGNQFAGPNPYAYPEPVSPFARQRFGLAE